MLAYLDDIIVLSQTFEKHFADFTAVFDRQNIKSVQGNREKCNFACYRVTYLGHWITNQFIIINQNIWLYRSNIRL